MEDVPGGEDDEDDEDDEGRQRDAQRKKDVQRRRRVVYDEDLGTTIAIRRRKRGADEWSEDDEYL